MSAWILFLDDLRSLSTEQRAYLSTKPGSALQIARSSADAQACVEALGMPEHMMLDHDLGGEDTVMRFLSWLAYEYAPANGVTSLPTYSIHSDNPVGRSNIQSFMTSWRRSFGMA